MGWFWAEASSGGVPAATSPPHAMPPPGAKPPPSCPMHDSSSAKSPFRAAAKPASKECPYAPPTGPSSNATDARGASEAPSRPQTGGSWISRLNPLNMMPAIANERAPSQSFSLSLDREGSSIPRGPSGPSRGGIRGCPVDHSKSSSQSTSTSPPAAVSPTDPAYADSDSDKWQYPSPQQMYNALLRKGYTDTDITAVPAMVSVHNFLNEGAWAEILEWERRFHAGLRKGWWECARGEENSHFGAMTELEPDGWADSLRAMRRRLDQLAKLQQGGGGKPSNAEAGAWEEVPEPRLVRFQGRPDEMTPRARWLQFLSRVWPSRYSSAPPFDRHDWYVLRHAPDGSAREVRYVIDYYGGAAGEEEATGDPVFYLDVRPAIDGPTGLGERVLRWGGDAWWKASGGAVRERNELEAKIRAARERQQAR